MFFNLSLIVPAILLVILFIDYALNNPYYSTQEPVVETIQEPVVETIQEPVVETIQEPVVETIQEPVVETIQEPIVETIQESKNIYVNMSIRELKKKASEWNKNNPENKIKKWGQLTKEELILALNR